MGADEFVDRPQHGIAPPTATVIIVKGHDFAVHHLGHQSRKVGLNAVIGMIAVDIGEVDGVVLELHQRVLRHLTHDDDLLGLDFGGEHLRDRVGYFIHLLVFLATGESQFIVVVERLPRVDKAKRFGFQNVKNPAREFTPPDANLDRHSALGHSLQELASIGAFDLFLLGKRLLRGFRGVGPWFFFWSVLRHEFPPVIHLVWRAGKGGLQPACRACVQV